MKGPGLNRIRNLSISGVFVIWIATAVSVDSMGAETLLSPPGLRLAQDPTLVIPAENHYPNQPVDLPVYRDRSGTPASGWRQHYVHTRRFASDQSGRIFFRNSDLERSISRTVKGPDKQLRLWPVGTTMVIESYKGDYAKTDGAQLVEIAVMSKSSTGNSSPDQAFYPANWSYARFNPDGSPSLTSAEVRQCHQCHSIAFHLTGDLIFTRFP